MLQRSGVRPGFFARLFSKTIDERCDEIFRTKIDPVVEAQGTEVLFHGVQDGCAVITITGNAETVTAERDQKLPEEILAILQQEVPEVKEIRRKQIWED